MTAATSVRALLAAAALACASACGPAAPHGSRGPAAVVAGSDGTSTPATSNSGGPGIAPGSPTPTPTGAAQLPPPAQAATGATQPRHATAPPSGASPATAAQHGGSCPDPRHCATYTLLGGSWPADASGRMQPVGFWINPTPPATSPSLGADSIERAILTAVAAWQAADPSVDLVYQGRTTSTPGGFDDVIGFAPVGNGSGITDGPAPSCSGCANPHFTSFDIRLDSTIPWAVTPCDPSQGQACTATGGNFEVGEVVTHELGHMLGLAHPPQVDANSQLTMYAGDCAGCRQKETLALGDILGVRALYRTSAPMPQVATP